MHAPVLCRNGRPIGSFSCLQPRLRATPDTELRLQFRGTLTVGFGTITAIFLIFGAVGYAAFGEGTHDVITQNLPTGWSTFAVKLALCCALFFTFPVMMVPVYEILENALDASPWVEHNVSPRRRCAPLLPHCCRTAPIRAILAMC